MHALVDTVLVTVDARSKAGAIFDNPVVVASLIAFLGVVINGFVASYFSRRIEAKNAQQLATYTKQTGVDIQRVADHDAERRHAHERIWNTANEAKAAAEVMVRGSATTDLKALIALMTDFLKKTAPFFDEAKAVRASLYFDDTAKGVISSVEAALASLFGALDFDKGDDATYQNRLKECDTLLASQLARLKDLVVAEVIPSSRG
jgi:hypothetical protein